MEDPLSAGPPTGPCVRASDARVSAGLRAPGRSGRRRVPTGRRFPAVRPVLGCR
ncbi:hypothetical protein PACID_00450 [Acidipropionibacterium acidipropionici ATCC 4875]|uniref:Uncharacterized protein n=1 Tax=Acidipropionibacterium acidipropionici (strain ATCC 4875 / DSM 20272 / JCM 6432 / NBRC 12425 / NCIMB 8070 / 4) TaxID=1171373 RepID=K7RNQ2_ACIA4|nr:hypothetical protein PACID_00450 [Acidipropionibacterium acidipropionici ATCC 4875]